MSVEQSEFNGEEIFRGIFFGQGQVADLFPELWENKKISEVVKHDDYDFTNSQNLLVEVINGKDASFFENFKKSIQSGNHESIRESLQYANNKIYSAAMIISNNDLNTLVNQKNSKEVLEELNLPTTIDLEEFSF